MIHPNTILDKDKEPASRIEHNTKSSHSQIKPIRNLIRIKAQYCVTNMHILAKRVK